MFGMSHDEDAEGRKDSASGCVWLHACFFFVVIDIDSSVFVALCRSCKVARFTKSTTAATEPTRDHVAMLRMAVRDRWPRGAAGGQRRWR